MMNETPTEIGATESLDRARDETQETTEAIPEIGSKIESEVQTETISARQFLKQRWKGVAIGSVLLLSLVGFLSFRAMTAAKTERSGGRGGAKREQVTPVRVATATQKTVPIQLQAIGNVQAASTVSVTPQAGGRITGVFFKKGQELHKGDLLFTIDDRSQIASIQQAEGVLAKDQAQIQQARATLAKDQGLVELARATLAKDQGLVRQAEATLAKDEAQAQYAQAQSDRYNDLYKQGAVSQDQAQQYSANGRALAATLQSDREAISNAQAVVRGDQVAITNAQAVVEGDQAAIANAEAALKTDQGSFNSVQVQSSYTKIYAPIDGRAGNILVTEGNVVQANSSQALVTITQIRPIQVSFAIPEVNLPEIQKRLENGKLKVNVTFAGSNQPIAGTLSFVNNTVDTSTGTIQLIGDFDNTDGKLFPGQFVNTTLTLKEEPNAIVIPAQAVQNGPDGQFVFVVNPDKTVKNVPVVASSTIDGLDVIQKGLNPGDQVVIDGQANLVTGSSVRINSEGSTSGDQGSSDSRKGAPDPTSDQSPANAPNKPSPDASPSPGSGKFKKHRASQSGDRPAKKSVGGDS